MSRLYVILTGLTALMLAVTGATFSIVGLAQLFSGAALSVMIMAGVLELSKLVAAGFLYRYWGHINHVLRVYLVAAVLTLIGITSMGIFGFLSNAYQRSSANLRTQMLQMTTMENEDARVQAQIADIRRFIDEIPRNRISRKFEFQTKYEPQIRALQKRSETIHTRMDQLKMSMLETQTKVGPIIYAAEAFGVDVDTVARWLIFVFVAVFDPLAVTLVFCWNMAVRLQEKYRGNELKIAGRAMMSPLVDHRYKKAG